MAEQGVERQALKRRGILAAAGAVVAGIVAKQTSQPVAAAATMLFANTATPVVNTALGVTEVGYHGAPLIGGEGALFVSDGSAGSNPGTAMVVGRVRTNLATSGVQGEGPLGGYGVEGLNSEGIGVYGHTAATNTGYSGVYGGGAGDGSYGVVGDSNDRNTGVPSTGIGVFGRGTNGAGVWGTSMGGSGVYGSSTTGYGVLGYSTGGSASLSGISTNANIAAFAGGNSAPGGLAASFSGLVYVNGSFVVADMTQKHGLLKHPDGSHRLMYTVEAPESWAEDFGTGTLAGGKAEVHLDPDFAALIHTEDYHVFLTEHDEHHALVVTQRTGTGFTVLADAVTATAKGKKSSEGSGTFSYRIVARPKSDKKVERLGKFTVPNVPLPDIAKLPKPPEIPAVPKKP